MVWIRKRDRRIRMQQAEKRAGRPLRRVEFEPLLSAGQLRILFDYEPDTGVLRRRSNGATFCLVSEFNLEGKKVRVARICWKIFHGEEPEGVIVHADKNPRNNRIENLRDVIKWSQP